MSGGFLERWSRRKLTSAGKAMLADPPTPAAAPLVRGERAPGIDASAAQEGVDDKAAGTSAAEAQLPPVEELTLASDFTAFLKEEVSEALRRKALHKLFADPHFNRMDGLDIYIDDYSLPDPIPPEAMAKLKHAREWLMANDAEAEVAARSSSAQEGVAPLQEGVVASEDADEAGAGAECARSGRADESAAGRAREGGAPPDGDGTAAVDASAERAPDSASSPVVAPEAECGQKGP